LLSVRRWTKEKIELFPSNFRPCTISSSDLEFLVEVCRKPPKITVADWSKCETAGWQERENRFDGFDSAASGEMIGSQLNLNAKRKRFLTEIRIEECHHGKQVARLDGMCMFTRYGNENRIELWPNGQWNDQPAVDRQPFVCEWGPQLQAAGKERNK
jgi:hypothetical protein